MARNTNGGTVTPPRQIDAADAACLRLCHTVIMLIAATSMPPIVFFTNSPADRSHAIFFADYSFDVDDFFITRV